jgi:hypothetical protein
MKAIRAALLLLGCIALVGVLAAQAQPLNKLTKVTFSQPVQVPGMVLPAGTYSFTIHESFGSRNVVQIWNEEKTQLVTTILAIHNYRLAPTGETVITFHESPADTPQAVKAWFYPGHTYGIEFVYPKEKALEIAQASQEVVIAETEEPTAETLKSVPLVAVTPEQKEEPVEQAIETEPPAGQQEVAEELPTTASETPLIAVFGVFALAVGFGLRRLAYQAR